jgi:hypothetical protein
VRMNSFDVFKVMWLTVLSASLTSLPVFGISITSPVSANDLVNVILGPDFPAVRNVTYTGAGAARGTFDGGLASGIGFDSGILLSTGHAGSAPGPNSSAATSQHHNLEGDTDLDDLLGVPTFDAAVLEFEFTLSSTADLEFRYVFASEEYSE